MDDLNEASVIVDKSSEKKRQAIQIVFLVVLIIAIAVLLFTVITIIRYKDMLQNPLGYSFEKFGIDYCYCKDVHGGNVIIPSINTTLKPEDAFAQTSQIKQPGFNISGMFITK